MKLAPHDINKLEKQLGTQILEFPSYLATYARELNKEFLEGEDPRQPITLSEEQLRAE